MGDGGGARTSRASVRLGGCACWVGGGVEGVAGCLLINSCNFFFFFFETSSGVHRVSTSALKKRKTGTLTY